MKIDSGTALSLVAVIRTDLEAIDRLESHVNQFDLNNINRAELESLGYSLHNLYNALENSFKQISLAFKNHVRDESRWHRGIVGKDVFGSGAAAPVGVK